MNETEGESRRRFWAYWSLTRESVFLGIWILSEAPSALQLVGVLFIIAGLLLTTLQMRARRAGQSQRPAG